jgi:hypothetical protein
VPEVPGSARFQGTRFHGANCTVRSATDCSNSISQRCRRPCPGFYRPGFPFDESLPGLDALLTVSQPPFSPLKLLIAQDKIAAGLGLTNFSYPVDSLELPGRYVEYFREREDPHSFQQESPASR